MYLPADLKKMIDARVIYGLKLIELNDPKQ